MSASSPSRRARDRVIPRRPLITPQRRLSLRASLCLVVPLLAGLLINQRSYSIVFSIGALWAISQDGLDEFRIRGPRLLWVASAATTGVALGATIAAHATTTAALTLALALVAAVAGFIEASNAATTGAYLLIGTLVGEGLGFTGHVWPSCAAIGLGALWVYAVAAVTDWRKRVANQRVFLANAYYSLADLVDALATPGFSAQRATTVSVIDAAQDVVGVSTRRHEDDEDLALRRGLIVALRCGEVLSYLEGKGLRASPRVAAALRDVGDALATAGAVSALTALTELRERFLETPELDATVTASLAMPGSPHGPPGPARTTSRASTRPRLPLRERGRFATTLALSIAAATLIARALDGPHGFWLAMSVAFILRPDLGPVITRALARTVGTVAGVAIAAGVAWSGNSIAALIALSCVMAAVVPWATRRSHVLAVMTFTPIVFVFLSLLGTERYLFVPRVLDTAIGAAIVLLVDLLVWSRAPSLRPDRQLERARAAAERYEREATLEEPLRRHVLRRSALRAVASARAAVDQANAEPAILHRHAHELSRELRRVEATIDAHTVALLESKPV